eukprot:9047-Heterococcus_DN1.PRE.1
MYSSSQHEVISNMRAVRKFGHDKRKLAAMWYHITQKIAETGCTQWNRSNTALSNLKATARCIIVSTRAVEHRRQPLCLEAHTWDA